MTVLESFQVCYYSKLPPGLVEREALAHLDAHTFTQILGSLLTRRSTHRFSECREMATRECCSLEAACWLCNRNSTVINDGLQASPLFTDFLSYLFNSLLQWRTFTLTNTHLHPPLRFSVQCHFIVGLYIWLDTTCTNSFINNNIRE